MNHSDLEGKALNVRELTITYLIGNGMDIGLGLNTRYTDFVKDYVRPRVEDTNLTRDLRRFVEESLKKDQDSWSYAELEFGKLPFSEFANKRGLPLEDVILELSSSFQSDLVEYLKREECRFQIPGEKFLDARNGFLTNAWHACYFAEHGETQRKMMSFARSAGVKVNFITLNYTRTLNKLLLARGAEATYIEFSPNGMMDLLCVPGRITVGDLVYAHGSMMDQFRLFGVNDDSQIEDGEARSLCKRTGYLIKTREDKVVDVGARARAEQLIAKSDYVVLMGLSYGVTDRAWWQYITDVCSHNDTKVVLCPYTKNATRARAPAEAIRRARRERECFFAGVDAQRASELADRHEGGFLVLDYGPHKNSHGNEVYCDPLNLFDLRDDFTVPEVREALLARVAEVQAAQKEKFELRTPDKSGTVAFEFSRNDGEYTISIGTVSFRSRWSECGSDTIYIYRRETKLGLMRGAAGLPDAFVDPNEYDWTCSGAASLQVGDVAVLINASGNVLSLRVDGIKVKSRGSDSDELRLSYKLL